MKVEMINSMGNDDTVTNSARVSFDKIASQYSEEQNSKLIRYLADHGHFSPFTHVQLQFRLRMPIFIARQWFRHLIGLSRDDFCRNEVSRRYVSDDPEFWTPKYWRYRPDNIKQGSSDEVISVLSDGSNPYVTFQKALKECEHTYTLMINSGVAPEQARAVLPQAMYTEFIETGSLYAYARICKERLHVDAQQEIQEIAQQISDVCKDVAPVSWRYLNGL